MSRRFHVGGDGNVILYCGATPSLLTSIARRNNIDPMQVLPGKLTPRRSDHAVHLSASAPISMRFGVCCRRRQDCRDAACASGARAPARFPPAVLGDAAAFSFIRASRQTGGRRHGDTNDDRLAERVNSLRNHRRLGVEERATPAPLRTGCPISISLIQLSE